MTGKAWVEVFDFVTSIAKFDAKTVSLFLAGIVCVSVFSIAWILYFYIGYQWIKFNKVSYTLKHYGVIFGFLSVIFALFVGAVFAAPAILLMLYINYFCAESDKSNGVRTVNFDPTDKP